MERSLIYLLFSCASFLQRSTLGVLRSSGSYTRSADGDSTSLTPCDLARVVSKASGRWIGIGEKKERGSFSMLEIARSKEEKENTHTHTHGVGMASGVGVSVKLARLHVG